MGVNLRDLFPQRTVPTDWYTGKRIAVDAHNVAWRYLTSIRDRDGDVLRNRDGGATSHLLGFTGLVRHLRERGAEPIFIWDGPVHPRKQATVEARIQVRKEAAQRAQAALDAGDMDTYKRLLRSTTYLDEPMIQDATRLLRTLGVAVATADHDGERYAAALCRAGHADAVATEDYDALVAGAPTVLRKAGGQAPFMHWLQDLADHEISLEQLRQIAIVCGTDWHPGVKGLGVKTALKAIRNHGDLRTIAKDVSAGRNGSRYHHLFERSGMDLDTFDDLRDFIAAPPATLEAPEANKPCPEQATEVAEELGLQQARVMACFC